ncbi:unnamed protein product [Vitrella brassicaformis CCMP3155]|uniref:V-SNARE coiled-coil homology domain-containing protein n=2 Tax=Vitrella brassicaformis TaxID=1169539 RepID=A0A0G4GG68_VITBC|nr:unnamed protein product [Vitrella brassicaformis CCMP3155]|mmetsp:Transcript_1510/g.3277  ORF Transcript_1510/g.3277 Transcript_1510/m.3277 type:complete len:223 (+) Transcript_1510:344-1012(+)|eukprot:CEM28617.1 unnamed protein product [Vitrella brassicaformis CCMP3155]
MTLIYALVARGRTVFAEHTDKIGNFTTVTRVLLGKLPEDPPRMSYLYDGYVFHYLYHAGLTYLVMSEREAGRRIPFAFLEDISQRFESSYGDVYRHAIAFAMNDEFAPVLAERMYFFNTSPGADEFSRVRSQIDEVQNVMMDNIERILQRGEKIDLLVDKTEDLNRSAFEFRRGAHRLKRTYWWRNARLLMAMILGAAILIFIIVTWSCGGFDYHRCRPRHK